MKVLPVESPLPESAPVAVLAFGPVLDVPPLLPLVEVAGLVPVTSSVVLAALEP